MSAATLARQTARCGCDECAPPLDPERVAAGHAVTRSAITCPAAVASAAGPVTVPTGWSL